MRKTTHYKFEIPKIVGLLSDKTVPSNIQRKFDSLFKRRAPAYVCLPFKVEPKYLKNVLACMRLMDIEGLIVLGNHAKRIGMNVIQRKNNRFRGYYIVGKNFSEQAINLLVPSKRQKTKRK